MRIEELQKKIQAKRLNLEPTLSEAELAEFEAKHQISLPSQFKEFLHQVGNGGDGPPFYKLLPLGEIPNDADQNEKKVYGELVHLTKEFPYTQSWCWEEEWQDEDEDENINQELEKKIESAYYGSIMLGTDGCGMNWLLIVTGESRGEVWQICGEGILQCQPKMDFIEWYNHWLENGEQTNYFR